MFATQDVGNALLSVGVAALLDLNIQQGVLRLGPQRAAGRNPDRCLRALLGFRQLSLTALRELQIEEHLRTSAARMPAFGQRDRELLFRLGPVTRVQVALAFGLMQVTLAVPLPYVRLRPARQPHAQPENPRDTDHNPLIGYRRNRMPAVGSPAAAYFAPRRSP